MFNNMLRLLFVRVSLFLAFVSFIICRHSDELNNQWDEWKIQYEKTYKSRDEESVRREIWEHHWRYVQDQNTCNDVTFKVHLNRLADHMISRSKRFVNVDHVENPSPVKFEPASWDWRTKGVVSHVLDQGQEPNVAAYVTAECVESLHAIQTGTLYHLSFNELGVCCQPFPKTTFKCVHDIGGLCKFGDYKPGSTPCKNISCEAVAQVIGSSFVAPGSEADLKTAVLVTPVFAAIDASLTSFQLYKSGVYDDPQCSSTRLDFAVQVVGYGTTSEGIDYWICRNDWGTDWGINGYILMRRNNGNRCGIATDALYPL